VKLATPATAFAVSVPESVELPGFAPSAIATPPVKVVSRFPCASRASTVIVPSAAPATPAVGEAVNTSCVAPDDAAVAVNVTGLPLSPAAVAVRVWAPAAGPSVQLVDAIPFASDSTAAAPTLPPSFARNVTVVPSTGVASIAVTRTETGVGSVDPAGPF